MSNAEHIAILRDEAERLRDMTPELKAALTVAADVLDLIPDGADPVETVRWALRIAIAVCAADRPDACLTACLDWWRACPADAREALRGWER